MARQDRPSRSHLLTEGGLLSLALIWGANFTIIKLALEELDPLAFNALRFPLASLLLAALLGSRQGPLLPPAGARLAIVGVGLLGNVVYQPLFIFGVDGTLAGNASLLLATIPVWTTCLSALAGHERPGVTVWMGVAGTVAGMALVVAGGDGIRLGSATLTGDLLMVAAALCWSAYTVGARPLIVRYGPLRVTAWTLWVGTVGIVIMGVPSLSRTSLGGVPPGAWAAVAYAGLLAISLAYLLWYRGVHRLGNARTSVYSNLVPVVALAVAWVWLGERPTGLQLLGGAVILTGITVARAAPRPVEAVRPPPEP